MMGLKQTIKNLLGDLGGWGRCPYSNRTFKYDEIITVWFAPSSGRLFSKEGVKELSDEHLIGFTKSLVHPTLANLEELESYPKFRMYVDKR